MRLTEAEYEDIVKRQKINPLSARGRANTEAKMRGDLRKRKGPNKTEAAFEGWIREHCYRPIGFECITLRMPGGTRYTPDWASMDPDNPNDPIMLWEVKGFMREAARVRLKEFAAHFTMFRFFLVRRKGRSGWNIQEV